MDEDAKNLEDLFKVYNNVHDPRIKSKLFQLLRIYGQVMFSDEADVINPCLDQIEVLNKHNIHVYVRRLSDGDEYNDPLIAYTLVYEDDVNEDVKVCINPGGRVI